MQRTLLAGALRRVARAAPLTSVGPARLARPLAMPTLHEAYRLCSSGTQCSDKADGGLAATRTTTTTTTTEAAAGAGRELSSGAEAMSPQEAEQARLWQERLAGLSPEDQALIVDALLHPERQKASVMGGPGIGPQDADMVAAFTCGKCDFRMVKKFSKHAYTKGIVIVECPNCQVKHLLADNLGWLADEATNIEDILREKGESFVRVGASDYQVVVDDTPAKPE